MDEMLGISLLIYIGILIIAVFFFELFGKIDECFKATAVLGGIAIFIINFVSCSAHCIYRSIENDTTEVKYVIKESYYSNIYAMRSTDNVHGFFILGFGKINDKDYYSYYYMNNTGSISRNKIPCDEAKIRFTTKAPYITLLKKYYIDTYMGEKDCISSTYIIYIHKNSIINNVKLGLDEKDDVQ